MTTKKPNGPPSTFKPEYCDFFIENMSKGFSFLASCGTLGISKQLAIHWRNRFPEFENAIQIGHAKRSANLEDRAMNATNGHTVTFSIAALKNCNPDEFREQTRHELSGIDGGAIETITRIELVVPGNDDR